MATGNVTWQTTPSLCWGNSLLTGSGVSNTLYSSVACAQNDDGSEHAQVFAANVSDGAVLWMFNASQPQQLFDFTRAVVGADDTLLVESEGVLMALG
jgi:outer membrane protein assembly factor BamB